jgi:hypothetical protein
MSLSCGREIGAKTERSFSPISHILRCYKLLEIERAFLTGLAHLYNVVPYQRRALHVGQCGVEVEGGRLPAHDWMLNLHILTSGGFR